MTTSTTRVSGMPLSEALAFLCPCVLQCHGGLPCLWRNVCSGYEKSVIYVYEIYRVNMSEPMLVKSINGQAGYSREVPPTRL